MSTALAELGLSQLPDGGYWQLEAGERDAFRRKLGAYWQWPANRVPTEKQMLVMLATYNRSMCTPIFFGGGMGGAKLLQWDTPIPTPNGFRRIDDLRPGDLVMGRDGAPTCVVGISEPQIAEAYRVTFDDGATLVAHAGHEWLTFSRSELIALNRRTDAFRARRRADRPSRAVAPDTLRPQLLSERNRASGATMTRPEPTGTVRTTEQILSTLRTKEGWVNHAVPVASALQLPERDLPLDPYLLGAWLGDGTATSGSITTMDDAIVQSFVDGGFAIMRVSGKPGNRASTYRFSNLRRVLAEMNVLGKKHVPHQYLWASEAQRLALLQGLLDTDGCAAGSGSASFTNTNKRIVEAVAQLARSLGHKVTMRESRATLYDVDKGPVWLVKFKAHIPVFRLKRKLDRLVLASRQTTRFRYITNIEPIGQERMRCIAVAAPDKLYLAGESFVPTHNSSLLCSLGIHLCRFIKNNRVLMFRKEYSAFASSTLQELEEQLEACPDARHWPGKHEVHFDNGSELWYMGVGTPKQRQKLGSTQFGALLGDEMPEIEFDTWKMLQTRLRKKEAARAKRQVIVLTGNPYPGWIKENFVTNPRPGYTFIPSLASDNPYLPPNYIDEMKAEMPDEWYQAFILGDWNAMVPATVAIPYALVSAAQKRREPANITDVQWGIDLGHLGSDYTWIARRMGYKFDFVNGWRQKRIDESATMIKHEVDMAVYKPKRLVFDYDGIGAGVADIFFGWQETGEFPADIELIGVNAQKTADITSPYGHAKIRYANVKAQNAFQFRRMLEGNHGDLPSDDEEVEQDLTTANYDIIDGRIYIESKKLVRKKLGRSPDKGDAMLLTVYQSSQDEFAGLPENAEALVSSYDDEDHEIAVLTYQQRRMNWYRDPFGVRRSAIIDVDPDLGYG